MAQRHRVIKGAYLGAVFRERVSGVFRERAAVVDGDTVHFKPADRPSFEAWCKQDKIGAKIAADGSVTLRFQGIDTPELHYGANRSCFFVGKGLPDVFEPSFAQPFGRRAERGLAQAIGLRLENGEPVPEPGVILVEGADGYGRLIAYALPAAAAAGLADGTWHEASSALLEKSFNCTMLATGLAYPLIYSSMAAESRRLFRDRAAEAKREGLEIWGRTADTTREFRLRDEGSIDGVGRLIFPKLFRRSIDYLFAVNADDFRGSLKEWIVKTSGCRPDQDGNDQSQDDPLEIEGQSGQGRLSELIECNGEVVSFDVDLFKLLFVDRRPEPAGVGPNNV